MRATLKQARLAEGVGRHDPLGLLVGCSGGRDSIALLGLLALVAEVDHLRLAVGHVDHGLRPEAAAEAAQVRSVAAGLGLPLSEVRLDLDPAAPGVPARARAARHAALEQMRGAAGAHRLALAHTATDQAETVLLHLCRGAGLRGLGGMQAVEPDTPIVRPLLELPRAATGPLCARLELPFVDDPTNDDPGHPRIRIRRDVLPALGVGRGGVEEALAASARAAREAEAALRIWIDREREIRTVGVCRYDLSGWRGLPRAIRVGVVQAIAVHAGLATDAIGRRTLEAIDRGLLAGGAKRWALAGAAALCTDGDTLSITLPGPVRTPPADAT